MHDSIPTLRRLAQRAEQVILEVYGRDHGVDFKEDSSPVTEADRLSHEVLVEGLSREFPGIPVLSEESGPEAFQARPSWSEYWLVDPLDGTKEFLHRNGEFTVNIALIQDGRPTLGVVTVPVTGEGFAGSDRGAFRWTQEGEPKAIQTRPSQVDRLHIVTSRSHQGAELQGMMELYPETRWSVAGSSLKFCRVATGDADLYPRLAPTCEWDTAAAQAVLEGAGGRVLDLEGKPLRYSKENLENPWFLALGDPTLSWKDLVSEDLVARAREAGPKDVESPKN